MAKQSMLQREVKRLKLVSKYSQKRKKFLSEVKETQTLDVILI